MSPKRMDGPDTVDLVTHYLHRLQAEGWVLEDMSHEVEYQQINGKGPKLPSRSRYVINLVPGGK